MIDLLLAMLLGIMPVEPLRPAPAPLPYVAPQGDIRTIPDPLPYVLQEFYFGAR
jgi:hypothetical protein